MSDISIRNNKSGIPGLRLCEPPEAAIVRKIEERMAYYLAKVRFHLGFQGFPAPKIYYFNQRSAAGYAYPRTHSVAFNRGLFEHDLGKNLDETVPHELAHLAVSYAKQNRLITTKVTAHGVDWKRVMSNWFGVAPRRTHSQPVDHLNIRRQSRWKYTCRCKSRNLSAVRHNRIRFNGHIYVCGSCNTALKYDGPANDQ